MKIISAYSGIALVFILALLFFPLQVFAGDGDLGARELREISKMGGVITSQSNINNGGIQVRFKNSGTPSTAAITSTATPSAGGSVSVGNYNVVKADSAMRSGGFYALGDGTQVFSASAITNVVKFSGANQLGQNPAVSAATAKGVSAGAGQSYVNSAKAIAGLRADPAGVISHMQMFTDYAGKPSNSNVRSSDINNDVLKKAGYSVPVSTAAASSSNSGALYTITPVPSGQKFSGVLRQDTSAALKLTN